MEPDAAGKNLLGIDKVTRWDFTAFHYRRRNVSRWLSEKEFS